MEKNVGVTVADKMPVEWDRDTPNHHRPRPVGQSMPIMPAPDPKPIESLLRRFGFHQSLPHANRP
jgi:hypothetical protein